MISKIFHAQNRNDDVLPIQIPGFNDTVFEMLLWDNKIVCIGAFTTYNEISANGIIRLNLDGTIDTSFVYGTGFNISPSHMELRTDNKLVICVYADAANYNGTVMYDLIILNTTGDVYSTLDTTYRLKGFTLTENNSVFGIYHKIYFGTSESVYEEGSYSDVAIIKFDTNLVLDTFYNEGKGFSVGNEWLYNPMADPDLRTHEFLSHPVVSNVFYHNSKVYVVYSRDFGNYDSNYHYMEVYAGLSIVRLNNDGTLDNTWPIHIDRSGWFDYDKLLFKNDYIIVAGSYLEYKGSQSSSIIMIDYTNTLKSDFNTSNEYQTGFYDADPNIGLGRVYDVTVTSGNYNICVGTFSKYCNTPISNMVEINDTGAIHNYIEAPNLKLSDFVNATIRTILYINDSNIYIAGEFTTTHPKYGSIITVNRILKLNILGELDLNFNKV